MQLSESYVLVYVDRTYGGIAKRETGTLVGHEAIGVVEEIGDKVTAVHPGEFISCHYPKYW